MPLTPFNNSHVTFGKKHVIYGYATYIQSMTKISHYTPTELIELYPDAKKVGWTPTKIGIMFRCGLLVGFISGKERTSMILEVSFVELMEFYNSVNQKKDIKFKK